MKHVSFIPSRAIAAAIVAALIASTGAAYAAGQGSSGTITVCVHRHGGGLYRAGQCARHDHKLSWNSPGQPGQQGPQGSPGPGAEWALVRGTDGAVLEQSGGITVIRSFPGNYYVDFPSDTSGKAIVVTPQWQGGTDLDLTANVARCGGTGDLGANTSCSPEPNDTNHVYVETWAQGTTGSPAETDVNFYISVIG